MTLGLGANLPQSRLAKDNAVIAPRRCGAKRKLLDVTTWKGRWQSHGDEWSPE